MKERFSLSWRQRHLRRASYWSPSGTRSKAARLRMSNRPLMAVHMQQCSRADSLNPSETSRLNCAFLASWSRRLVRLAPCVCREEIYCGAMGRPLAKLQETEMTDRSNAPGTLRGTRFHPVAFLTPSPKGRLLSPLHKTQIIFAQG